MSSGHYEIRLDDGSTITDPEWLCPADVMRSSHGQGVVKMPGSLVWVQDRPDWDTYFIDIAKAVAARGECTRSQVGAVLVRDERIRATGYNGAPRGKPSCLDGACPRATSAAVPAVSSYDDGPTACIALHAEQNALLYASRDDTEGGTLYVTREPCADCQRMIDGSGITRVVVA